MKKNVLQLSFFILIAGVTLWFVGKTGFQLFHYYQLREHIPINIEKWEIKEKSSNSYVLHAIYSYSYLGKSYKNESELEKEFPNPWAAEKAKALLHDKKWSVWVNPKKPGKTALEKSFPFKSSLSSLVLFGLMGYFLCLGLYVRKEGNGKS